jgi:hypothetical protein
MSTIEHKLLWEIAHAEEDRCHVSVEAVEATFGRGLVAAKDLDSHEEVAREVWPIASIQDNENSWMVTACAACHRFIGSVPEQLRQLATATASVETWEAVAESFPALSHSIKRHLENATRASTAAAEEEDATAGEEDDEDCDDHHELCLLPPEDEGVIPPSLVEAGELDIVPMPFEAHGLSFCSEACMSRARDTMLFLLVPEGQGVFSELLEHHSASSVAADSTVVPSGAATTDSIATSDAPEFGISPEELCGMLSEHAHEHSESFSMAARVYAWLLGEFLAAPPGQDLARCARKLTLLCTIPWRSTAEGGSAGVERWDDVYSRTKEALLLVRSLLGPRFTTVMERRRSDAAAASSSESEEDVRAWTTRVASRGWGDVASGLEAAELSRDDEAAAKVIFSEEFYLCLLGVFDVNSVGISIASPVHDCLSCLQEAGVVRSRMAAAASSSGPSDAASATVARIEEALMAASLARRLEGSPEEEPVPIAQTSAVLTPDGVGLQSFSSIDARQSRTMNALCPPMRGTGLFPLVAMTNHSRTPNAEFIYPQGNVSVSLVSKAPIRAGEQVCISYINEDLTGEERTLALAHYGFNE